jgi:hypothetical protein
MAAWVAAWLETYILVLNSVRGICFSFDCQSTEAKSGLPEVENIEVRKTMIEVVSCLIGGHPLKVADAKRVGLHGHRLSIKKLSPEDEATLQSKLKQQRKDGPSVPVSLIFSSERENKIEAFSDSFRFHEDTLTFEEIE